MEDFPSQNRGEEQGLRKAFQNVRQGCSFFDVWLQNISYAIVNHFLWKLLIVYFTIVLLFGRPCQVLFFPAHSDTALKILNIIGLVIFVIDMIFNSILNPMYLPFVSCNRNCQPNAIHSTNNQRQKYLPCVYVGSFNFWCDFLSTLCFILDFFYLGSFFLDETITIHVNDFGVPVQEIFKEFTREEYYLLRSDRSLVILIFKTARVARLLPPEKVLNIVERINTVWNNIRISSYGSWNRLCNQLRRNKEPKEKKNSSTAHRSKEIKRVARRAIKEEEKKIKEKGELVYAKYLLMQWTEQALKFLRILPKTKRDIEMDRQIAAIRIQRAWRNHNAIYTKSRSGKGEGSQDWMCNPDGIVSIDFSVASRNSSQVADIGIRSSKDIVPVDENDATNSQKLTPRRAKQKESSQAGATMARLTGQRVAIFLFVNLLLIAVLAYNERDTTRASTMVILHGQTTKGNRLFAEKAVDTARRTTIPNLYSYIANSTDYSITLTYKDDSDLHEYERRSIIIKSDDGRQSTGLFSIEEDIYQTALMELILLFFVLLIWFFGVANFAGPIMALVITPIERAVKLLSMLVMDPLGYQSTSQYKDFLADADKSASRNGRFTREVLKGMETEFLNSTIERIGSLMRDGFGSAGVQIIRNNLQKGNNKDSGTLILNSKGTMASCIFVFCDIRGFTDATECLQEEVFLFTNRVAAVVHSICSAYGGDANKNIGDAFLVSWRLDGRAIRHRADKALLSVVKICIALRHNDHYVEMLSEYAKTKLLTKLKDRPGPTVQVGFGLHAGKAVEGAIGSQRKIDATYVSTAVELAEYLESSTKKYKVQLLMSDSFHRILQPTRRQQCRKIDRVMVENENEDFSEEEGNQGKMMELFTYDIDVDALWEDGGTKNDPDNSEADGDDLLGSFSSLRKPSSFQKTSKSNLAPKKKYGDKLSFGSTRSSTGSRGSQFAGSMRGRGADITAVIAAVAAKALGTGSFPTAKGESNDEQEKIKQQKKGKRELVLPTGPALYSENVWLTADMRRIRRRYTTKIFDLYNLGLQKFYSKRWNEAKIHFEAILDYFEDGPSLYFLAEVRKRQEEVKK